MAIFIALGGTAIATNVADRHAVKGAAAKKKRVKRRPRDPGPTLSDGTYCLVAEASIQASATPLEGFCTISSSVSGEVGVGGAFALPANDGTIFSFSGIATLTRGGPGSLVLGCVSTGGAAVVPSSVSWWVSPVGS